GGGDLIRPWSVDERYFHKAYLRKPVYMVGLGVPIRTTDPSLNDRPHVSRRYAAFFQHPSVQFVGLRDDSSRDWVVQHLNPTAPVVSVPDIVCALDLPTVTKPEGAPILGIATRLRPNQDEPDDYTELARLARSMQSTGWRIRHLILGTGPVGERDRENADDLVIDGKEVFYTEDLDDISRAIGECTALASMKFHGSVVATMYGVPSMVLIPTSKNRSFMRRIGRDDLLSVFNDASLTERFDPPPVAPDAQAVAALRDPAAELMRDLNKRIKRQTR
ncbi:MAG: polysaccharide pyruvyl transferase family protein, partial [Microcella sp.]